jgi:MoaA/NifB/PqqE/SkfB family radical SAM enzyme
MLTNRSVARGKVQSHGHSKRKRKQFFTTIREWKMASKAILSQDHPILAHIIPIRRCNLSCGYCNEYDDFSDPIPIDVLRRRLDRLAELGTSIVTISGGEPLMHPELEKVITRIRSRGMLAGLITNGYLMSRDRIRSLNAAGLEHLQISIDNIQPDQVSKKSLKVLDKKLRYLAELADFKVNINSVLGAGIRNPVDALVIGRRAVELGFTCTVGVIHDGHGALKPLSATEDRIYNQLKYLGKKGYAQINRYFQDNLLHGKPNNWRCRAGARYLYICEDGLVHYCSQQRGHPAIPLEEYTVEDIRREYRTKKPCAPYCTISCVHQASVADFWRAPQDLRAFAPRPREPVSVPTRPAGPMEDLLQLE